MQDNRNSTLYQTKQVLIDYLFSNVDLSKFKYRILKDQNDLQLLLNNKYMLGFNYIGYSCLLIFIKIGKKYYSYLIDRKTLNYSKNKCNMENIKIIEINVKIDLSIYNGTIFDGIYNFSGRKKTFIITDCYCFRGNDMVMRHINNKMMEIDTFFKTCYNKDNAMNDIQLIINKLHKINELETLANNNINRDNNLLTKGIVFYPEISDTKLIFLFNSEIKQNKININDNKNNKNIIKKTIFKAKTKKPIILTFLIKKTQIIDTYSLFLSEKINKNEKKIKMKKIDIAYVPTKECSRLCKILLNNDNKFALVKCKFITDKQKWIPLKEDKKKQYPSLISEMEEVVEVIEIEDEKEDS